MQYSAVYVECCVFSSVLVGVDSRVIGLYEVSMLLSLFGSGIVSTLEE